MPGDLSGVSPILSHVICLQAFKEEMIFLHFSEETRSLWEVKRDPQGQMAFTKKVQVQIQMAIPPWNVLQPRPVFLRDIRQPKGPVIPGMKG